MTDKEINIAIAEACGWQWRVGIYQNCRGLFHPDDEYLKSCECTKEQMVNLPISSDCAKRVPDYCNDLNAMHEAENTLNEEQKEKYFFNLMCVFGNWPKAIQANARHRAEAFLRALGKWKESAK